MKKKGLLSIIACVVMAFSMALVGLACGENNNGGGE